MSLLTCAICGAQVKDYLGDHIVETHGISTQEYLEKNPGAQTVSTRLWDQFQATQRSVKRSHPVAPTNLKVSISKLQFSVNVDVPAEACLPMPSHYRFPTHGTLGDDISHVITALWDTDAPAIYVWGMPGSGKDALIHAWSAMTRTPALIRQVKPGTDIESWFFTRGFNEKGTYWEEGEVLKALRDGYLTTTGRRVPYLILVTDFDRADREQGEHLRLITDSIQGRVDGPAGRTYVVLPGTRVVATANTAGGGDERGRMISANPLDASLLDRFSVKKEFHWMDWRDEVEILKDKFPLLTTKAPSVLKKMQEVTKHLREAILNGDLHGEFSHRALCNILAHAERIVRASGKLDKRLLKWASIIWIDGLPDAENRQAARNIMDPRIGMLDEGDTSHINSGDLSTSMGGVK